MLSQDARSIAKPGHEPWHPRERQADRRHQHLLAASMPNYWLFAGALVIVGLSALTFTNGTNSFMQLSTEPAMRGRVMAIRLALALGTTPIGAPMIGRVADSFGPRWALALGGTSGLLAALVAVWHLRAARLSR